jgi:hypothetical protein
MPRPCKLSLCYRFSDSIFQYYCSPLRPAYMINFVFITLKWRRLSQKVVSSSMCNFPDTPVTFSFLGPNIPPAPFFNLSSSLDMKSVHKKRQNYIPVYCTLMLVINTIQIILILNEYIIKSTFKSPRWRNG